MTDDLFASPDPQPAVSDDGVPRDRWGRYLLPSLPKTTAKGGFGAASKKTAGWTRATTFAKSIADTFALNRWGERMAIKGITMREELYALAAATPLEDRDALDKIVEDAKRAAGSKKSADLGTALHKFTESLDRGLTPIIPKPWQRDVAAYRALTAQYGFVIPEKAIERIVVVDKYNVAGTFDRIAKLTQDVTLELANGPQVILQAGQWVILDLKTGRDLSYGWNEIAIQLALYAMADAIWNPEDWRYEKMPKVSQKWALVVHLPVGEAKAQLVALELTHSMEAAQLCWDVRLWRKARTLTHVIGVAEAPPAPDLAEPVKVAIDPEAGAENNQAALVAEEAQAMNRQGREQALRDTDPAPGLDNALAVARAKAEAKKAMAAIPTHPVVVTGDDIAVRAEENAKMAVIHPEENATISVHAPSWADRVKAATTRAELSALWKDAKAAGEWTDELTELGKEQISKMASR